MSADQPTAATPSAEDSPLRGRVAAVIERIRPAVQADGGDIELVEVSDAGRVSIRFHGACVGCPSSAVTLYHGIDFERRFFQKGSRCWPCRDASVKKW